jgi:type IV pilus assembly protein PilV
MTEINVNINAYSSSKSARGFSLVEVMVALVVVAIGLLGLAKMESLALASTTTAGTRSIAAIQASSMAAAMHANRAYWGAALAPATTTITTATAAGAQPACTFAAPCTGPQLAAWDMQQWSAAMNAVLPPWFATITCTTTTPPVNCTIQISWSETGVAINAQQTNMSNLTLPTYTIFLEP